MKIKSLKVIDFMIENANTIQKKASLQKELIEMQYNFFYGSDSWDRFQIRIDKLN